MVFLSWMGANNLDGLWNGQLQNTYAGAVGKPKTLFKASIQFGIESLTEAEQKWMFMAMWPTGLLPLPRQNGKPNNDLVQFNQERLRRGTRWYQNLEVIKSWKHLNKNCCLKKTNGGQCKWSWLLTVIENAFIASTNSGDKERAKHFQVVDTGNYLTIN